MKSKRTSSAP